MDPASLAFGVVSLAMQLMQTTAAIKKLIVAYKSAAKELSALSDKLDDVEIVCSSLKMVLDNFDDANRSFEIALLNNLQKVISDCHTKVTKIYELVSKIMHNPKQSPLRTTGVLFLKWGWNKVAYLQKTHVRRDDATFEDSNQPALEDNLIFLFLTQHTLNLQRAYFADERGPFNLCVWAHVVQTFLAQTYPTDWRRFQHHLWVPVVREALSRGVDIHTTAWPGSSAFKGSSALQRIFSSTDDPDTALELVDSWIDLLEQAGLETQRYLEIETERCASLLDSRSHRKPPGPYHVSFIVREQRGRRLPYWTETIDEACPVRELFTEFPHFKQAYAYKPMPKIIKEMHRGWKTLNAGGYAKDIEPWPVFLALRRSYLDDMRSWRTITEEGRLLIEGLDRACDLMESRFERNQMRKLRKAGYTGKRVVNSVMPGAWVD
ncbi:hypothetical protein FALBO_2081 [Fusarium albosuccineum]|uniref:Fungal N-terminal domain-containing protein n=1 Tax=Fusarium albosuccineum TaxID=1237068 RepID=A0A8H4LP57_9HYPO|nr:hypothetical protein FALBO_2081 [Fusarium albosuccineum]